jgi:coniferyl-aldehyde dehydrogenase
MNLADLPLLDTLNAALAAQRQAYLAHPVPSLDERKADLRTLQRFVRENETALCEAISADYGHRSRHETLLAEVFPAVDGIDHVVKHLRGWMKPQRRGVDLRNFFGARNRVIPQPLGVVGVIVPWNFPLNLSMVPLSYIFAAGNRAMVKMSENSRHLARLLIDKMPAYFPPDKLQFFDETGGVGVAFSQLQVRPPAVHRLGHHRPRGDGRGGGQPVPGDAGTRRQGAGHRLRRLPAQAGGRAHPVRQVPQRRPDLHHGRPRLAAACAHRRVRRAGQGHRAGALPQPGFARLHRIIDARSFERLLQALDDARARGATVLPLLPGPAFDAARRKIAPHLVLDAPADSLLMQREIFGPILPLVPYDRLDEVVQRVNAGPRPLAIYPFSHDGAQVQMLLDRVMSGGVSVNDALFHVGQHDLPFGGVGDSGMGHYHGYEGFVTFSKLRPVFYQARFSSMRFMWPPYGKFADWLLRFLTR